MKKIFLMLTWATFCSATFGQDNSKMTIALEPLTIPQGVDYGSYPQQIFKLINDEFAQANRFVIMPTDEWNVQQGGSTDPYVDVAKTYGVTYIFVGVINSISSSNLSTVNPNGTVNPAFSARISFSVKIINSETGLLFNSKNFEIAPFMMLKTTPEAAINAAINNLSKATKKWIGETFPVTIQVVKIMDQNAKKGAVRILINAGSESGIVEGKGRKKTQFKIVEFASEIVNGTQMSRTVQVGTAEVTLIEDKNFADCLVTSGGFDVARKISEGLKLFALTVN